MWENTKTKLKTFKEIQVIAHEGMNIQKNLRDKMNLYALE